MTTPGPSADSPVAQNDVNPGEFLEILFDLEDAKTLADVVSGMAAGALRIGIHVQAPPDGGRGVFVNVVPVAGRALLGMLVLCMAASLACGGFRQGPGNLKPARG